MQLRKLRPSPSLVVASMALAVATGGTSYAAMMVGSPEIRDGSVRSIDVADDSVRSKDVHDGSIQWKDFRPGARPMPTRWALVDAQGDIVAQSGGFSVTAAYPVLDPAGGDPDRANGNVYINTGEDLSDNGITATVALQNTVDQNNDAVTNGRAAGPDSNPEFSGEMPRRCASGPGPLPALRHGRRQPLVVRPRLSNGGPPTTPTASGSTCSYA